MIDEIEKLFDLESYLDRAEKDFLLNGREEFRFSLRFTRRVKAGHDRFEKEIRAFDFLRLDYGRTVRSGHVRVGRISEIAFDIEDLLRLRPELRVVRRAFLQAFDTSSASAVRTYVQNNYALCRRKFEVLPDCVDVLEYLFAHRESVRGRYCRQIPHGKSTKLIGREALLLGLYEAVRRERSENSDGNQQALKIRWSDFVADFDLRTKPAAFLFWASRLRIDGHAIENFDALLSDENIDRLTFPEVKFALIVENEETFYSVRDALRDFSAPAVLIAGGGAAVGGAGFLAGVLQARPHYYWGDMDASGYEIFHGARSVFPALEPLLMNHESLRRYESVTQQVAPVNPRTARVPLLDSEYRRVCRDGLRIEQEHIAIEDLLQILEESLR